MFISDLNLDSNLVCIILVMSVQMIPILELRLKKTDFYTSFVKLLTGQSFRGYANEPISIPHKGGRKELPTFLLIFRFTKKKICQDIYSRKFPVEWAIFFPDNWSYLVQGLLHGGGACCFTCIYIYIITRVLISNTVN